MLTVNHYARIRQLRRDGLTLRAIADQLHHSPKTILKALENPERVAGWPANSWRLAISGEAARFLLFDLVTETKVSVPVLAM